MKNELQEEAIITRLIERIESGNTFILTEIGKAVKEIGQLTPTQAYQLQQMIKYGASYQTILERLSKITNLNTKEIDEIYSLYAQKDYNFARKFYEYRNIPYVPFNQLEPLKREVQAISNLTKGEYTNLSNTSALGFTIKDLAGNVKFYNISNAYQYVIDQAILSVSQGKDTFQHEMYSILKSLGESGLKTVDYKSGYHRRLDSAIRMNLREGIKTLHNETQRILGEDFGADGVEISVHLSPAPDHEDLQGRQFSNEEFEKLQNNEVAKDYKGNRYSHEHRPISELNCYHTTMSIILGVSKPQYSDKELQDIKERNEKGFMFEGKYLTMYESTQLQRKLETEIRKQKDIQMLGKASGNDLLIGDAQFKITQLTNRYKELSKTSGLQTQMERLRVVGYKRKRIDRR